MGVFFVSWALWEEMTFVLACAIVLVFLIGVFKLWQTSRQVRRQELIDEEKKARLTEMRKVGGGGGGFSPKKRHSDIPFGIRAIQSGIEVDGIWISRPTTPSRSSSKSKIGLSTTTTLDLSTNGGGGGKNGYAKQIGQNLLASDAARPYSGSTLGGGRPTSQRTTNGAGTPVVGGGEYMATGNGGQTNLDAFDTHSNLSTPLPQISEDATVPNNGSRGPSTANRRTGALNEEALRRLEGAYSPMAAAAPAATTLRGAPQLTTYIPSSRMSSPSPSLRRQNNYLPQQKTSRIPTGGVARTSTASADSLTSAGGASIHSNHSTSSRSSSSRSSRSSSSRQQMTQNPTKHDTIGPLSSPVRLAHASSTVTSFYTAYVSPPTSPASPRIPSPLASPSLPRDTKAQQPALALASPSVPPPRDTFFPGEAYANRATRKVNAGFEVLPAGTFGRHDSSGSSGGSTDEEPTILDSHRRGSILSPARNKLWRASGQ